MTTGQVLRRPAARSGARLYLAVDGGIEKDVVLGSRATFIQGGIGGAAIKSGDVLTVGISGAFRGLPRVVSSAFRVTLETLRSK